MTDQITSTKPVIGIDPGRNFGCTYMHSEGTIVLWGQLEKGGHLEYGVAAYDIVAALIGLSTKHTGHSKDILCAIEGASYGSQYGQVGLAEIRFGFYLGLIHHPLKTVIIPPQSCRKFAFGSAKIKARELWPCIDPNGADSVGVAMALAQMEGALCIQQPFFQQ